MTRSLYLQIFIHPISYKLGGSPTDVILSGAAGRMEVSL